MTFALGAGWSHPFTHMHPPNLRNDLSQMLLQLLRGVRIRVGFWYPGPFLWSSLYPPIPFPVLRIALRSVVDVSSWLRYRCLSLVFRRQPPGFRIRCPSLHTYRGGSGCCPICSINTPTGRGVCAVQGETVEGEKTGKQNAS